MVDPSLIAKPVATVTIEADGNRNRTPRGHLIRVSIKLNPIDPKYADKVYVTSVAQKALEAFPPSIDHPDRRSYGDIPGKAGREMIGVEGSVVWSGRPGDAAVEQMSAALRGEGYRVSVRELRECIEAGCLADVVVDWNQPTDVPTGWYSHSICGKHDYKMCERCESAYLMTSTNAAGQAPSVRCEVCGALMVEWGGTKIWNAELVTRGRAVT